MAFHAARRAVFLHKLHVPLKGGVVLHQVLQLGAVHGEVLEELLLHLGQPVGLDACLQGSMIWR